MAGMTPFAPVVGIGLAAVSRRLLRKRPDEEFVWAKSFVLDSKSSSTLKGGKEL